MGSLKCFYCCSLKITLHCGLQYLSAATWWQLYVITVSHHMLHVWTHIKHSVCVSYVLFWLLRMHWKSTYLTWNHKGLSLMWRKNAVIWMFSEVMICVYLIKCLSTEYFHHLKHHLGQQAVYLHMYNSVELYFIMFLKQVVFTLWGFDTTQNSLPVTTHGIENGFVHFRVFLHFFSPLYL